MATRKRKSASCASPTKKRRSDDQEETKIELLSLAEINGELQEDGEHKGRLQVNVPGSGYTYCYLGTIGMTMQYQTKEQTVVDGNLSLEWIIRPDPKEKGAVIISNTVTDKANDNIGPQTYLTVGDKIKDRSDDLRFLIVQRPPQHAFFFEEDPNDEYKIAIYTSVNKVRYFLQPSPDKRTHTIVALKSDSAKDYPFEFLKE